MWSYSGNPSSSAKDAVRFLCGDTDQSDPLLQDEEIAWILSLQPDLTLAAADACDAIAARFSRQADTANLDLRVSASQRAEAYRKRAQELRLRAKKSAQVFSGGRSVSGKVAVGSDLDRVQPVFRRGMDDNPAAGWDG